MPENISGLGMGSNKVGNSFCILYVCCKDKEKKKTGGQGRVPSRMSSITSHRIMEKPSLNTRKRSFQMQNGK